MAKEMYIGIETKHFIWTKLKGKTIRFMKLKPEGHENLITGVLSKD